MSYDQGSVVLVPFPFTDLSTTKQRPALVLRSEPSESDLIVCAITSQLAGALGSTEVMIPTAELPAWGLPKPSKLKLAKLFTIHRGLVRKRLGEAPPSMLEGILEETRRLFVLRCLTSVEKAWTPHLHPTGGSANSRGSPPA